MVGTDLLLIFYQKIFFFSSRNHLLFIATTFTMQLSYQMASRTASKDRLPGPQALHSIFFFSNSFQFLDL
jgi:hypothetical protein